jgi:hypothetical protein
MWAIFLVTAAVVLIGALLWGYAICSECFTSRVFARMKKVLLLSLAVVLLCELVLAVWRYRTTRDDYVFRDLRLRIAQIEHGQYVESVSIEMNTMPITPEFWVTLRPETPEEDFHAIARELMDKLDAYVYRGAHNRSKQMELFPGSVAWMDRLDPYVHYFEYGHQSIRIGELFPGNIRLFIELYDERGIIRKNNVYKRTIEFEDGVPTVFVWVFFRDTEDSENPYVRQIKPYNHPYTQPDDL